MWCCIEHFYFPTDTSSLDSFIRLEYFLSFNMFKQTNSSNFFSSHPHEYDEVKHFLTSLTGCYFFFQLHKKEQLFHAFVSRLFHRVGVRWRARVRAGPVVLKKKGKGKKKEKKEKRKEEETFSKISAQFRQNFINI